MDWMQPYEVDYTAVSVTKSWMDGEPLDLLAIDGIDVSEESATATISLAEGVGEQWIRLYANAHSATESEKVALFTGITSLPKANWDGVEGTYSCEVYSSLSCADDVLLPIGWWTDGHDPAQVAAGLLARSTPAPVEWEQGSPQLTSPMVAEDGESCGSMARKLVDAINWRIRLAGDGRIYVERKPSLPSDTLDESENDVMLPEVDESIDLSGIPNVYRVTSGDDAIVVYDDDADSMFSTVSRGREIWAEERGVTLNAGESLESYAIRKLRESQDVSYRLSYTREYMPLDLGDLVRINLPSIGIDATYMIESQHVNCGVGITVDEGVVMA